MDDTLVCPPPGASADWTIPQNWEAFTPLEHATWDRLFARQQTLLPGRVVPIFLEGLHVLRLSRPGVPDFAELSDTLSKLTGWSVVAVPGLIPDDVFYEHLANRRFPAGNFIRKPEQLDYLEEPDVFHDVFGHVPLLANPVFADYMQAYGEGGRRATQMGTVKMLASLYWYTVEFGLIRDGSGLKLYGAGLASSYGEATFALESPSPNRLGFDLKRIMGTAYRIDDFQQNYFVIDSFEELLRVTLETDFAPIYEELRSQSLIPIEAVLPSDRVMSHGTQEYARARDKAA